MHKKKIYDITSRDYSTMIGYKGEIAQLHVLHWVTLIIPFLIS